MISDLYKEGGIYWYTGIWNWSAWAAFSLSIFPSMPGLVATCGGYTIGVGWIWVYNIAYFLRMFLGSTLYFTFCHFWPPPGSGVQEETDDGRLSEAGLEFGTDDSSVAEKIAAIAERPIEV